MTTNKRWDSRDPTKSVAVPLWWAWLVGATAVS